MKTDIPLSLVTKLEKRIGIRIWDGVLYNRDSITDPWLTIIPNEVGNTILEILKLEPHLPRRKS